MTVSTFGLGCKKLLFSIQNIILYIYCIVIITIHIFYFKYHDENITSFLGLGFLMLMYSIVVLIIGATNLCDEENKRNPYHRENPYNRV